MLNFCLEFISRLLLFLKPKFGVNGHFFECRIQFPFINCIDEQFVKLAMQTICLPTPRRESDGTIFPMRSAPTLVTGLSKHLTLEQSALGRMYAYVASPKVLQFENY